MTSRFASSLRKSMRPLSFNGIFASDCHEQLKALLSRNRDRLAAMGMPNAETFLAEPMYDAGTGQIDWYHEGATPPVPLLSLPPEERARAEQELACCSRALDSLLADLSAQPAMSVQAGLLREALQHPGPDDVFVQDGHIVLVNWGYKPGTSSAAPVEIGRDSVPDVPVLAKTPPAVQAVQPPVRPAAQPAAAPVQPAPEAPAASFAGPAGGFAAAPGMTDNVANPEPDPEPAREEPARFFRDEPGPDRTVYAQAPQPEPEPAPEPAPAADGVRGAGCLSWLLPLLLLALLLWLILAALGLAPSPLPAGCFHTATAPAGAAAEQDRARRQAGELAALQRQLEEHAAQCPRTDGTKPAPLFEERGLDAVPGAGPEAPAPGIVPEVGGGAVIVPDGTVPESVPGTEGEALVPGVAPDGEAGPLPDETPAVPPSEGTVPDGEAVVPFFGEEPGGSAGDAPLG
ncbi:MAG: hypothetical protein Q4F72_12100, partial [Desulfovibrionaceae bacterium]|nr:hypothetical protein [Desulfovibrionaceae bacterium]